MMNFCYVLTSGGKDYFAEMAAISVALLRRLHRDARVWLLTDVQTESALRGNHAAVLSRVDKVVCVDTGAADAKVRSRIVKTSMRRRVEGDFVYLDVDALPVRPLDEIFAASGDMAAVLDRHDPPERYRHPAAARELFAKLGWRFPARYYNGGVMLLRDTPAAHRLGLEWEKRWEQTRREGHLMDQFSFNSALADMPEVKVATLPARFNAQIAMRRSVARNAAIIHIFTTNVGPGSDNILGRLAHTLKTTGKIDEAALDRFIRTGYPWTDERWVSGQWAVGHYGTALGLMARKALGLKKRTAAPREEQA